MSTRLVAVAGQKDPGGPLLVPAASVPGLVTRAVIAAGGKVHGAILTPWGQFAPWRRDDPAPGLPAALELPQ